MPGNETIPMYIIRFSPCFFIFGLPGVQFFCISLPLIIHVYLVPAEQNVTHSYSHVTFEYTLARAHARGRNACVRISRADLRLAPRSLLSVHEKRTCKRSLEVLTPPSALNTKAYYATSHCV